MLLRNKKKEFILYRNFACKIISHLPKGKYIELTQSQHITKTKSLSNRLNKWLERLFCYMKVSSRTLYIRFGLYDYFIMLATTMQNRLLSFRDLRHVAARPFCSLLFTFATSLFGLPLLFQLQTLVCN